MESSTVGNLVWKQEPRLGGLFVLHFDGRPLAATALVDRDLPLEGQIHALEGICWPPPQQLAAVLGATLEEKVPAPSLESLPGDRRLSPFPEGFAAAMTTDEDPSTHPVRRYLFPDLNRSGEVALDPGERIITTWKSYEPELRTRSAADGSLLGNTYIPKKYLRRWRCALTNQRLVYHGSLSAPTSGDHDPSIPLPGAVSDTVGTFREIKDWVSRRNLHWGFHVRHEWLSEFGYGNLPNQKRPLLLRRDDTLFLRAACRLPSNDVAIFRFPYKQSKPAVSEIAAMYADAVREAQPELSISGPQDQSREVHATTITFREKLELEVSKTWTVQGGVPWSMPPRLEVN